MDFQLTPEQRMLQETAREIGERELASSSAKWDREDEFPWENVHILQRAGFLGMSLPAAYGGSDASVMDAVLVKEQIARFCRPSAFILGCANGLGPKAIALYGNEDLKREYLPEVVNGECVIAWAMSEPEAGSDIGSMRTNVTEKAGHYVLNGSKTWISLAAVAHAYVVITRFGDTPGLNGLGALLVPRETRGLAVGSKIHTLGLRGTGMAELFFDECEVPRENVLLGPGGFRQVLSIMSDARVAGNPPTSLGIAQAALDVAVEHLQQRVQFGRKLAEFQGLQWKLADMVIKLEAARLLVYRAAVNAGEGFPAALDASIAKVAANEAAVDIARQAVQIFGASGYADSAPQRLLRDALGLAIGDGTVEIQRNMIASHILKGTR